MVFPEWFIFHTQLNMEHCITKDELKSLAKVCKTRDSFIYGWRKTRLWFDEREYDVTIKDVANYCDIFYIGGTKIGALCGEAIDLLKQ